MVVIAWFIIMREKKGKWSKMYGPKTQKTTWYGAILKLFLFQKCGQEYHDKWTSAYGGPMGFRLAPLSF